MPDKLNVWIVGDSVMWGQGLNHADKFALQAVTRIAALEGKEIAIAIGSERFTARSGAKLLAREDTLAGQEATVVALPSGKTRPVFLGDSTTFYDRFPRLFTSDLQAEAFLDGKDESTAAEL